MDVLFVCTGNTCRSPMSEGFLKSISDSRNLDITVSSAGLYVPTGSVVSDNSVKVMSEFGIDISNHTPKQITLEMVIKSDYVIAMTQYHKNVILTLFPDSNSKVLAFADIDTNGDIVDPFGSEIAVYKQCADMIYSGVKKFVGSFI